jgi:L-ascorbate metabolism protein UlaG (beta-lactamase superfamily)
MNFGGRMAHGQIHAWLVPAIHSTALGYPPAGFILEIAGTRVYASGDTDYFGDMQDLGERYKPQIGIVCAGNGAFTMGPPDAAQTCKAFGVSHAVPVHYAHNALVLGPSAGELFRAALAEVSPRTAVTVMRPGESAVIG